MSARVRVVGLKTEQGGEQTDLSGTYTGTIDCLGMIGDATLTVNGNQFILSGASTASGRIVAETTRGYSGATLRFDAAGGGTPTTVSVRARKMGDRLSLSPVPGETNRCSFTPAGAGGARGHRRRRRAGFIDGNFSGFTSNANADSNFNGFTSNANANSNRNRLTSNAKDSNANGITTNSSVTPRMRRKPQETRARGASDGNANANAPIPSTGEAKQETITQQLRGKIAHKIPQEMKVGVKEIIEIRIAKSDAGDFTTDMQGRGQLIQNDINIGPVMAVYLRPEDETAFAIRLVNRVTEVQRFGNNKFISWQYSVEPLKPGPQRMRVIAVVGKPDSEDADEQEVYNEAISVQVNYPYAGKKLISDHIEGIVGGLFSVICSLVGYFVGKRRPEGKTGQAA